MQTVEPNYRKTACRRGEPYVFEQSQFQRLLGNDFLQFLGLALEILDLIAGRGSRSITREAPLAGFEELLGPAVVEALGNAFVTAELGDRSLAAQAIQDDADLLFSRSNASASPGGCP